MISFRYHLVTIVAVFLALGLGVLAGTTVLDQALVDRLERETEDLTQANAEIRERLDAQSGVLDAMGAFGEEVFDALAPGTLLERRAVVLSHDLVEASTVTRTRDALETAGAVVEAVFTLQSRMSLRDPGARAEMADILGLPPTEDGVTLRRTALERIAERLAFGPGRAPGGRPNDVLTRLLSAGFLTVDGPGVDTTLEQVGGPSTMAVVVGGGTRDAAQASPLLVPLTGNLRVERLQTAAAQAFGSVVPFVREVREADTPATVELVTVAGVDLPVGQLGLVLGMQRLAVLGEGGAYGVGPDATEVIPALQGP